jgi:hypothetical protein
MTRSVFSTIALAAAMLPTAGEAQPVVTITGVRLTQGDAVKCPTIRADDGSLHPVSYLAPDIPIGGRVTVRGFLAVTTHCIGTVLVAEEVEILPDD